MGSRRRTGQWAALLVAVALGATVVHLYFAETPRREPTPSPLPTPPAAALEPAPPSPVPAPTIAIDDEALRRLAAGLSSHPAFASWLAGENLLRRFVAATAAIAEGTVPRGPLGFLEPVGSFQVRSRGGSVVVDPASYRRYDTVASVVESLDPAGCARLYRELHSSIEAAYRELGLPEPSFDDVLAAAIGRLLAVPVVEGEVRLEPRVRSFRYADERLESLDPAQKQLLRMGPENVRKVQGKLRELAGALGLSIDAGGSGPSGPRVGGLDRSPARE
jgi:hypothetical protein